MVYQSLKKLLSKYPWFFDKSESSNFFRSQYVTNRQFQDLYQSLFTVIQSFKLDKRCLIWKDQTAPYDYIINFVANFPNMKSVSCYKNDNLIYSEHYTYEENVSSFIYFYDSSDETISMEDVFEEIDDEPEEEIPIIPTDTFKIIVETYDEYQIIKGFPENDTRQGNEFDHDYSLDRIGQIDGIPRKQYIETVDYAHTEPPYNDRLTEDDYHYMNRILNYNLRFHNTPRPVLEIWKLYGIFSDMVNREQYLFKMFDEKAHLGSDGEYDPDWTPMPWEHKDSLCRLANNLGEFFFVSANTLMPVQDSDVRFDFRFLNSLAEPLTGDYNVSIFLNDDLEPLYEHVADSFKIIPSDVLADDLPNKFTFQAYRGEEPFASDELTVIVRGCSSGDWYVSPNGSDSNSGKSNLEPFQTISKAVSRVNGEENLIVLMSGTHTITDPVSIPYSCTILGCGNPIVNNTNGLKFFNVLQNKQLTLQNVSLNYGSITSLVSNTVFNNNNKSSQGFYVVLREESKIITLIEVDTDKSSYVVGNTVIVTGTLTDEQSAGLSGKSIKIYVNDTLVDTVTTQNNTGNFSKQVTATTEGNMVIRAVFEGDNDYYSSTSSVTVPVSARPVPASISLVAEKPIMSKGENNKITATVLDSNNQPCVGETVSFSVVDGEDLGTAVTDASGEAFVYYLGKGVGDLYIKAECVFVSKRYDITDAIKTFFRDTDTFSKSPIRATANPYTITDGVYIETSQSSGGNVSDASFQCNGDWECTFDFYMKNGNGGRFGIHSIPILNNGQIEAGCFGFRDNGSILDICSNTGSTGSVTVLNTSYITNTWYHIRLVTNGTTLSIYIGDTLVNSKNGYNWLNDELCIYSQTWATGSEAQIKNVVFKPL